MKKLYTFLIAVLLSATTFAQTPEKMSYQAVVRDSGDALVTNQAVGMQISILQTTATGTAVYVETQTPTTNVNGLVTLEIGTGSVISGDFTTIDWSADTYFIKTETDPTGGSSYTITGTSQLLSVPYALHAKTADSIVGGINVTETDPVYTAWDKSTGISITESQISDLTHTVRYTDAEAVTAVGFTDGTSSGDMKYWNGSTWVNVNAGANEQVLTFCGGVPTWLNTGDACPPAIGDLLGGGIVFWVDGSGGGLIAATTDQVFNTTWGCSGVVTGAIDIVIGTGDQNTLDIELGCATSGIAADVCANSTLNGYSDWYLPSKDELNQMYINRGVIGTFQITSYWSSSEINSTQAWRQTWFNGSQIQGNKTGNYPVRAIRAF